MMAQPEEPGHRAGVSDLPQQANLQNQKIGEEKASLRLSLRAKRKALSSTFRLSADAAMTSHFIDAYRGTGEINVGLYAPVGTEVCTAGFAELLRELGARTYYPRLQADELSLDFVLSDRPVEEFSLGAYQIPEPEGPGLSADKMDLILLPGLGFDRAGGRLGQGKGCFDRALRDYNGLCAGLTYTCQIVDTVPMLEHDRPIDILFSESGVEWASKKAEALFLIEGGETG